MNETTTVTKLKFKKLNESAVLPTRAHPGDAGLDLTCVDGGTPNHSFTEYDTGIAVEIPEGYVGLVFPRSSISNQDFLLKNSVGVIDSGYTNSIKLRFYEAPDMNNLEARYGMVNKKEIRKYKKGEKIGQLVVLQLPQFEATWTANLTTSERGKGGFGSSGK